MKQRWLILSAIPLLLLVGSDTFACKCGKPTVENSFARATAIFSGEVIKRDFFKITLKIEKVWKGKLGEEVVLLTDATKSSEGNVIASSCDYKFAVGKKYLVYAAGPATALKTSVCTRTAALKDAGRDVDGLDLLRQKSAERRE